jgi:predicted metal-dependent phosphoesterase TrpH
MASRLPPLLCELHAHTTWSDGALTPRELCDLYGRVGFDVLAITDHTVIGGGGHVVESNFDAYLDELDAEAERARRLYDLLVIPGLELTHDDADPARAGHAVALGLRRFVGVDDGLETALRAARAHGAALVAAHPSTPTDAPGSLRPTAAFAADPARLGPLVDRFELFNRETLFPWVAEARLPAVASGDFHELEHLATWKTLLPCAREERAVVGYLRSPRPAFLVRLERPHELPRVEAAPPAAWREPEPAVVSATVTLGAAAAGAARRDILPQLWEAV